MKTKTPTINVSPRFSLRLAPALVVAAVIACWPLPTRANTIVFNTLGPGDTYKMGIGYGVLNVSNFLEIATQFTAGASGFLATVDLGLTFNPAGPAGPVNVFLYGDASGSPNNASQMLLGSGTPTAAFNTTNNSIVSLTVAGNVPVTMGSLYWLVLKPAGSNVFDIWNFSSPSVPGTVDFSNDDSTWSFANNQLPAFRITARGAAGVPDSASTWTLLLLGVTATFGLKFFARRSA